MYQTQTAVFPCGLSDPKSTSEVTWLKNDRALSLDKRMTLLPSGSLEITNVNYPDRGSYKCVTKSGLVSR